jgi:hypothetical protein
MPGFQLAQAQRLPLFKVVHASDGFLKQTKVDVLALQPMVVIEPFRINQSRATFTIFRDNFLAAFGLDLFAEFSESGAGMAERDDVFRRNRHKTSDAN